MLFKNTFILISFYLIRFCTKETFKMLSFYYKYRNILKCVEFQKNVINNISQLQYRMVRNKLHYCNGIFLKKILDVTIKIK